jgi:hypothetical protein
LACVALVSPKEYPEMEGGRPRKRHACCVSWSKARRVLR